MERRRLTLFLWLSLGLLVLLVLVWGHYRFIVGPLDYANKDFMSLYTGARAVLRDLDPYDPGVWGPLRAEYGSEWFPDLTAPFPLWTFVFMIPFALLPLSWAAAAWLVFSELLLALSAVGVLRYVRPHWPRPPEVGLLLIAGYVSIITLLVLINGQMTFLLLAFLVLFLVFVRGKRPFLAGVALSMLALKPNPFILFVPLLGLWLLWQRRWRIIAGGLGGGVGLLALTWLIQPEWIGGWLAARGKTAVVTITPTLWGLAAEVGGVYWFVLGMILVGGLTLWLGWYIFKRPALSPAVVVSLGVAASLLTTPYTWAYEQALLFLPWMVGFAAMERRRGRTGWFLLAWLLPWILFAIAAARLNDAWGFITPLATLAALVVWQERENEGGYSFGDAA